MLSAGRGIISKHRHTESRVSSRKIILSLSESLPRGRERRERCERVETEVACSLSSLLFFGGCVVASFVLTQTPLSVTEKLT